MSRIEKILRVFAGAISQLADIAGNAPWTQEATQEYKPYDRFVDSDKKCCGCGKSCGAGMNTKKAVEKLVEGLYNAGVRDPYGPRSSLVGISCKGNSMNREVKKLYIKPSLEIRTKNYDTTVRYIKDEPIFITLKHDVVQFTSTETGPVAGTILEPPTKDDPFLTLKMNLL